jgi:hypothetical protein
MGKRFRDTLNAIGVYFPAPTSRDNNLRDVRMNCASTIGQESSCN